jgi:hypothetical protein
MHKRRIKIILTTENNMTTDKNRLSSVEFNTKLEVEFVDEL